MSYVQLIRKLSRKFTTVNCPLKKIKVIINTMKLSWATMNRLNNERLYGNLYQVSDVIKERRVRFSRHYWRVLLYMPTQRRVSGGPGQSFTKPIYVDIIRNPSDQRTVVSRLSSSIRHQTGTAFLES